jgi:signal transduction histidine kinase
VRAGPSRSLRDLDTGDLERRVLAAVGDAVVVLDLEGRIVGWEGAAERLLGRPAASVLGQPAAIVFPPELVPGPEQLATIGGVDRVELVLPLTGDRIAAVSLAPLRDQAGQVRGATATVKPVGAWLDPAETSGPPRRRWHRILGGIVQDLVELAGRDLAAIDASEQLARVLVRQARRLLPDTECLLAIVGPERPDHFQIAAGAGAWAERQVGKEWVQEGTLAGRALRERRPVETVRVQELSSLSKTLADGDINTGRLLPLLSPRPLPDGRVTLGVLGFYRVAQTFFTPYERRLMDEFVRLVSVSLQRTELRRSTAETLARLQTGVDVAVDLASSLEPGEVIRRLTQRAVSAVSADRASLFLLEEDEVVVVDSHDSAGHLEPVGRRFPLTALTSDGEPILELAAREGRPRISGPHQLLGLDGELETGPAGSRYTLTLPLVLAGSTMGVLVVARRREPRFTREDALTLQLVGSVAALMLRNARLFAEAKDASRLRSEFLNMAAHELRTPLTVINGYLSMLNDGSLGEAPARWRGPVELLATKAAELGRLVDDLLLTSRLESGGLPARSDLLDLCELVDAAAQRARPRLDLVGGQLEIALPMEPVRISGDPEQLSRILDNLLNNALTYRRPAQPAWVRLQVVVVDQLAMVAVEDRGRGVPVEMRERIFERFVRADESSDSISGTGLGLYISRQLAERHGGQVELKESGPAGSRFVLRLPLAQARD